MCYTGEGKEGPDKEAQINIAAAILYRYSEGYSLTEAKQIADRIGEKERKRVISAYVGSRANRRHKPGRAFENLDYTFDLRGRVGIYRDLQRHRVGTQERQNFSVRSGFETREEYAKIGIDNEYKQLMAEVKDLYEEMHSTMPYQAQYVVTFGFNARWYYKINARQLFHLCELRTTPAGHPDYRKLVQQIYGKVREVHPSVTEYMKFINMSDKPLGRLESEVRIAVKRAKAGLEKYIERSNPPTA